MLFNKDVIIIIIIESTPDGEKETIRNRISSLERATRRLSNFSTTGGRRLFRTTYSQTARKQPPKCVPLA